MSNTINNTISFDEIIQTIAAEAAEIEGYVYYSGEGDQWENVAFDMFCDEVVINEDEVDYYGSTFSGIAAF